MTKRNLDELKGLGRETSKRLGQHHGLVLVSVGVNKSVDYATTLRKFESFAEQRHTVIPKF